MPTLVWRLCFFHSSSSHFQLVPSKPIRIFFSFFSSPAKTLNSNSPFFNYLTNSFKLTETEALSISNRFSGSWVASPEKPQSVHSLLREYGFSETQIRYTVRVSPRILFLNVKKILKPKIEFFKQLGLVDSDLGKFISHNSTLLTVSLERKLVPCVEILKKILVNDKNGEGLIRVINRCNAVVRRDPQTRLLRNVAFLQSCGIVGSQLSTLLKSQSWLFVTSESYLRELVSRALHMGFSVNSRMLVHALYTVSCLSSHTFRKKVDLFGNFGFSEQDCVEMFRRAPSLFRASEEKLKFGIDFFMNRVKYEKSILVRRPGCLISSMENCAIPRFKVLQVIKLKKLLDKEPSFYSVLYMTEEEFLDKFISRFRDDAEELLFAYKGHLLDFSEEPS